MALTQDIGSHCFECKMKCPGFKLHEWRKTCENCNCSVENHNILDQNDSSILEELQVTDKIFYPSYTDAMKIARASGHCWLPPGVGPTEIDAFRACIAPSLLNKSGDRDDEKRYRKSQLRLQIPIHDRNVNNLKHVATPTEKQEAEKFLKNRNIHELGIGSVVKMDVHDSVGCSECRADIGPGQFCVMAEHSTPASGSEQKVWHPGCFKCSHCHELLVDYIYGWQSNKPYCIRHYGQLLRPRCGTCDELIFTEEYTRAMEQEHHPQHFACKLCDESLTGHRYILKDDNPLCITCYEEKFAQICEDCNEKIGCDSKDLSFKDRHWHEKCFSCFECLDSLVDKPFVTRDDHLYCSVCFDEKFAARCDSCNNVFKAGMRKYEYRNKQWHEECFVCSECAGPIGSKSFIPREQNIVCVPCYEEHYAQKCSKCTKVIRRGGVTYKGAPWHKECFTCANCEKQLAGIKFTSKEDKAYCGECYGELFAKKCTQCHKPITGFGGCKFISFEDRHWHSNCFNCSKCELSLVGKGFLTHDTLILCPECGH